MSFNTYVTPNYSQGRFSAEQEIIEAFPFIDYRDASAKVGGINIVSDGIKAVIDDSDNSTMVVGATGSKKTRNIVMPYVYSCALAGYSMFIHDPKGDINKNMYKTLKRLGYKIIVLDYRDPEYGARYNPLEKVAKLYKEGNVNRAKEMIKHFSNTIFNSVKSEKDPFWCQTSESYCAGLISMLCDLFPVNDVTIDNIYNLHIQGDTKYGASNYMKCFFEDKEDKNYWKLIYPVVTAPNETRSSLHSVFSSCLNSFVQNEAIIDQTSNSTFCVEDLIEEKTAVFIVSRDEGDVYNSLIAAIIDQFYEVLTDWAERHEGCLKRKVCFVLDEFGNLAKINDIEKKISLSRARGITWFLVCQSLEQLSVIYGEKIAPIILGNCNNLVYLYSPDISLLKRISELCGEREDEITGKKTPLCSVEMLRHLDKDNGECLMLLDRKHPFITHLPDISEYYGVEPTRNVNVRKRKKQEITPIDFREMVHSMKRKQIKDKAENMQHERLVKNEERKKKREKLRKEDPNNLIEEINEVIYDLIGGE